MGVGWGYVGARRDRHLRRIDRPLASRHLESKTTMCVRMTHGKRWHVTTRKRGGGRWHVTKEAGNGLLYVNNSSPAACDTLEQIQVCQGREWVAL